MPGSRSGAVMDSRGFDDIMGDGSGYSCARVVNMAAVMMAGDRHG